MFELLNSNFRISRPIHLFFSIFSFSEIEFYFNVVLCIVSYAIPLFGIIYWYVSVPFFLKRRALSSLVASRYFLIFMRYCSYKIFFSSAETAMKYVIRTVFLLTAIYIVCWSPYWISMFAHKFFPVSQKHSKPYFL